MKHTTKQNLKTLAAAIMLLCLGAPETAQAGPVSVREAVEKALNTNPEIKARFHAFRDVYEEQGVANGGYWPRVDATAGIGREWLRGENVTDKDYWRKGVRLELTQMLFDGFYTCNQVCRLKHSGQARYFEFMDTMESVGLESYRAYADVLRYREMVRLAKRNYDYHQEIFNQVSSRVRAGVGAGVDVSQISARVALAQSNYLTEMSNLHDVTARFQRLVGELPEENMQAALLPTDGIPATAGEALKEAYQHNPGFLATMSDINAAKHAVKVQESKFYPRLDFKARHDWSWDLDGIDGRQDESVVELVMTYNILNGGSDAAAVRQYREKMYRSVDMKDKGATDLRQTMTIAYNDRQIIGQQVRYLDAHRKNLDQVRVAYREQFNIGKRTLLDLLDTENEYYQAQRAYYNGFFDLTVANARALAGMGKLLTTMNIVRGEMPSLKDINIPLPRVTDEDVPPIEIPVPITMAKKL
jgi:outer membrane protein, adhesin transport system